MRRSALLDPSKEMKLGDKYRILGKIGEGTYGYVFKVETFGTEKGSTGSSSGSRKEDDKSFAAKVVKSHKEGKNDVIFSMATLREIKILRELHHDNIVALHDVHVDHREKSLALVFEYAHHDLRDIIVQSKQMHLSEYTRKSFMFQILKGLKYLHDNWIIHRDMKPQNILVVGQGRRRGYVKLADFGLARIYQSPVKALSDVERVVVTLWYRAPELLLGAKHYTKAVDIWSAGCIFAEILNSRELFCGKEVEGSNAPFQRDQCDKIFRVLGLPTPHNWPGVDKLPEYRNVQLMARDKLKYPVTSEIRKAVQFGMGQRAEKLCDLISKMLDFNPDTRITAADALLHPYFTETDPKPRDWAFDEPGREPISFQMQKVLPVNESQVHGNSRANEKASARVSTSSQQLSSSSGVKRPYEGSNSSHRDSKSHRHR